jgi:GNAT superfamily N-acetyltransferase
MDLPPAQDPQLVRSLVPPGSELAGVVDEVAARAVPAWQTENVDGWVARYSPGMAAKRVNSVWPREDDPSSTIDEKLAAVEHFYAARDLPARFQVSPAAQPAGLDRALGRRGYERGAPTSVELRHLTELPRPALAGGLEVVIDLAPTTRWSTTWQAALGLSDDRLAATARLFGRVANQAAFVTVSVDGSPAGVGMGVVDGRWLGIFNMATLPGLRRSGVASAALGSLADWARRTGADRAYLQVDLGNVSARALYRAVGFETAYHYAYWTLPANPDPTVARAQVRQSDSSARPARRARGVGVESGSSSRPDRPRAISARPISAAP